jgi:hypothetical protein
MSIISSDNINVEASKPTDSRYGTYTSTTIALSNITTAYRYIGLTVGIISGSTITEYWFQGGIADINLIQKTLGGNVSTLTSNEVAYVSNDYGNDTTAIIGNPFLAFKTIQAAINSFTSGSNTVYIFPGIYTITTTIQLNNYCGLYCEKGVIITSALNGSTIELNTISSFILGKGYFSNTYGGTFDSDAVAINVHNSSYLYLEADTLTYIEVWDNSKVDIVNTTITSPNNGTSSGYIVYNGSNNSSYISTLNLKNCFIKNLTIPTIMPYGNASGQLVYLTHTNCKFYRDIATTNPNTDTSHLNSGTSYTILELGTINTNNPVNQAAIHITFNNCNFINLLTSGSPDGITIANLGSGYSGCTFNFIGCNFYLKNSGSSPLKTVNNSYTFVLKDIVAAYTTTSSPPTYLMNNNISNTDVTLVNNTDISNVLPTTPLFVNSNFIIQ